VHCQGLTDALDASNVLRLGDPRNCCLYTFTTVSDTILSLPPRPLPAAPARALGANSQAASRIGNRALIQEHASQSGIATKHGMSRIIPRNIEHGERGEPRERGGKDWETIAFVRLVSNVKLSTF
jgi:hypothetical protein